MVEFDEEEGVDVGVDDASSAAAVAEDGAMAEELVDWIGGGAVGLALTGRWIWSEGFAEGSSAPLWVMDAKPTEAVMTS